MLALSRLRIKITLTLIILDLSEKVKSQFLLQGCLFEIISWLLQNTQIFVVLK